jgi:trimethylamine:corrinoid methyltransferase-like protein
MTDLAHYLGFPLWAINSSAAAEADAQLGWDTMATLLSQYMHGTDIIGGIDCIAAGSLFDPRALVLADEMAGWIRHFGRGIELGGETIPLDLMMDLGTAPFGGDFLSAEHTLRNYRDTLWQPSSMTNRLTRDAWIDAGEPAVMDRAVEEAHRILGKHQPGVSEEQQSQLRELVAEVLDREGIAGDEAKRIMDRTYWSA